LIPETQNAPFSMPNFENWCKIWASPTLAYIHVFPGTNLGMTRVGWPPPQSLKKHPKLRTYLYIYIYILQNSPSKIKII
jgi:hypothetical protein